MLKNSILKLQVNLLKIRNSRTLTLCLGITVCVYSWKEYSMWVWIHFVFSVTKKAQTQSRKKQITSHPPHPSKIKIEVCKNKASPEFRGVVLLVTTSNSCQYNSQLHIYRQCKPHNLKIKTLKRCNRVVFQNKRHSSWEIAGTCFSHMTDSHFTWYMLIWNYRSA